MFYDRRGHIASEGIKFVLPSALANKKLDECYRGHHRPSEEHFRYAEYLDSAQAILFVHIEQY
jgi:hypothetical protein